MIVKIEDSKKLVSFDEMQTICNSTDNFDYVDEVIHGRITRSFNYRLDIFDTFNQLAGRNFRGTTYDLETKELLAAPFFKFFNYNQSPFTLDPTIRTWNMVNVFEKVDGSMIYFYKVNNNLVARTQRRCSNIQAIRAMYIVNNNERLKNYINKVIDDGYTPIFELISPIYDQHIVYYKNELLCFLALRDRVTGKVYMSDSTEVPIYKEESLNTYPIIETFNNIYEIVDTCTNQIINDRKELREGYVVLFDNNELIKFKRLQFINLQRLRDSITNEKNIVSMLFMGTLDDIFYEFRENQLILDYVNNIIQCVNDTWNRRLKFCKSYYEENKYLDRKQFAIKAQKELDKKDFTIVIMYLKSNGDPILDKIQDSYIKNKEWQLSDLYKGEMKEDE